MPARDPLGSGGHFVIGGMMLFGPYSDFQDCVAKNGSKDNPEAFCAWLHHEITGAWPGEMTREMTAKFQALATRTIEGVEIFSVGLWTDSKGQTKEWTDTDIQGIITVFNSGQPVNGVPLKVGHTTDAFNRKVADALGVPTELVSGEKGHGAISLGQLHSLKELNGKLIATFNDVPMVIADLIEGGQYRSVSAEMELEENKPRLTAVALLGAQAPAVENLASLSEAKVFSNAQWFTKAIVSQGETDTKSLLKKLSDNFDSLFARLGGKGMVTATADKETQKFMLTTADLPKLYQALGLSGDPDINMILQAIQGLKGASQQPPPGGQPPAPQMSKASPELIAMQKQVDSQAITIKTLEHDKRVAQYTKVTTAWIAIPGKPEELAEELATLHETAGEEVAKKVMVSYTKANETAKAAGILAPIGSAKPGTEPKDEFEAEVDAWAISNKTTFERALAHFAMGTKEEKGRFAAHLKRMKAEQEA